MKIVLLLLASFFLEAKEAPLYSSHPQISSLLEKFVDSHTLVKTIEFNREDPHHSEYGPSQLKQLVSVEKLVVGPKELNPSLHRVLKKRKKETLILKLPLSFKRNSASYSHFWLYPEVLCSFERQIIDFLKITTLPCDLNSKDILKNFPYKAVVLTHTALQAHIQNLGLDHLILFPGHHHRLNAQTLKSLARFVKKFKNEKVLWIKEFPMAQNLSLKKYIKQEDKVVKVKILEEDIYQIKEKIYE